MFSFSAEIPDIAPSFAHDAARHLLDGDIHRAMELCTRGVAAFPHYATGYFVLGKCYEALGRTVESLVEYRRALSILPDNLEVQQEVKHAEEKEQKEFQKFAKEQEKKLEGKKEPVPVEQFLSRQPTSEESAIEYLAKRLQDAKRMQPNASPTSEPDPVQPGSEQRFVTVTIAEIYASQGAFNESINAYQEILKRYPEEKERFEKRIRELEELRTNQQHEKKLEGPINKKAS